MHMVYSTDLTRYQDNPQAVYQMQAVTAEAARQVCVLIQAASDH